jgi:dephospho-CoA kinase
MVKRMNVGLTGGIACGKSTVAGMLVRRGALSIDLDQIAREVVLPGSPVLARVVDCFGQGILNEDGSLNRKALGEIVFNDPDARKKLESITHPAIRAIMVERMAALEQAHPDRLVVVEVPLLYESGLQAMFDEVMVVYVPRDMQLARLRDREGLSPEQAEKRLNAQLPIEDKKKWADVVIDNSGTLEQTERQVDEYWKRKGLK